MFRTLGLRIMGSRGLLRARGGSPLPLRGVLKGGGGGEAPLPQPPLSFFAAYRVGLLVCHGVALSYAYAALRIVSSSKNLPMS